MAAPHIAWSERQGKMGFFEKDWIVRQLKMSVDMAASLILGKEFSPYQITDPMNLTAADTLHQQMVTMLEDGDANGAEDLLFDTIDGEDISLYEVGLDFYNRLTCMEERDLEAAGFVREEIRDGLIDLSEEYGCAGLFEQLRLSWSEED